MPEDGNGTMRSLEYSEIAWRGWLMSRDSIVRTPDA